MKTVTFFSSQGMEDTSGFGRCFPIAKEFAKKGFVVNVLATHADYYSLKNKKFTKNNVNIHYVGQMHVLKKNSRKYYFSPIKLFLTVLYSTIKMSFYGIKLKTDVLYCFKPQPVNGTAAFLSKLIKNKPLIIDCDDYESSSSKLSKTQKIVFKFFESQLPKLAEKITHNTKFIKEHLISLGVNPDKFIYIPDGVDWERLSTPNKEKISGLRKTLHLESSKVILYFGTISLNYGHSIDLLINAFPKIKNNVPNAKLLIVGGGDSFDEIQKTVQKENKNDIIFSGRVSFEDFPYYLKLADVSVDPVRNVESNKARYALKIVESIAMNIPVVTSNIGDRFYTLDGGKVGLFVRIGDVDSLANGLIEILKNDSLRKTMIENCATVIKNHEWTALVDKIFNEAPFLHKYPKNKS